MTGMPAHLAALRSPRPVLVLHADRSPSEHALRSETRELVGQLPVPRAEFWHERPGSEEPAAHTGLMSLDGVELPADATVFLCGPLPFMRTVRARLVEAGIPAAVSATRSSAPTCGCRARLPERARVRTAARSAGRPSTCAGRPVRAGDQWPTDGPRSGREAWGVRFPIDV